MTQYLCVYSLWYCGNVFVY